MNFLTKYRQKYEDSRYFCRELSLIQDGIIAGRKMAFFGKNRQKTPFFAKFTLNWAVSIPAGFWTRPNPVYRDRQGIASVHRDFPYIGSVFFNI